MNAVMSRTERVSTETHVERELVRREGNSDVFAFRLMWENTTIAQAHVIVPTGTDVQRVEAIGLGRLLSALSS